jgi:hypothetical protein
MKKLELLNNVERAKLMFDLFPGEIPSYVHYTKSIADAICNDPDYVKHEWEDQLITIEFWLQLAAEIKKIIERYKGRFTSNSRLLSDQLFDGYLALFSIHCLHQYTASEDCRDESFKLAAEMFYRLSHP